MDNVALFFTIFGFSRHWIILDQTMIGVTHYLNWVVLLFAFVDALWGEIKEKRIFLTSFIGFMISYVLLNLIRLFIINARPFISYDLSPLVPPPSSSSFPSGHATMAATIATAYFLGKSRWKWLTLAAALLVGFSRVYVGVHYPLDVLAGFGAGILIGIISWKVVCRVIWAGE